MSETEKLKLLLSDLLDKNAALVRAVERYAGSVEGGDADIPEDRVLREPGSFNHPYSFGDEEYRALYTACMDCAGIGNDIDDLLGV